MLEIVLALALQASPDPTRPPPAPPPIDQMLIVELDSPLWRAVPSKAQLRRLGKELDLPLGSSMRITVVCDVDAGGALKTCNLWQKSANAEFDRQLLDQMKDFQIVPTLPDGRPTAGRVIYVRVRLTK